MVVTDCADEVGDARRERLAAQVERPALRNAPRGIRCEGRIRRDSVFLLAHVTRNHLSLCMRLQQRDAETQAELEAIEVKH